MLGLQVYVVHLVYVLLGSKSRASYMLDKHTPGEGATPHLTCLYETYRLCRIFKTESLYVALVILVLAVWARLASDSERSSCFCLPVVGLKVCVASSAYMCWCRCTKVGSLLLPRDPRTSLRLSGLPCKEFHLLSHLASPLLCFTLLFCVYVSV